MPPLQFGDIAVHLVNDGYLNMDPATFFPDVSPDVLAAHPGGLVDGMLHIPMITFLIQVEGRTILVDTGLGPHLGGFNGVCGALLDGLAEHDVRPEQVDTIVFTHLHPDHVGWNCTKYGDDYRPTFPSARYVVTHREYDRWSTDPAGYLRRHVKPLAEAGQLDLVTDGYEPGPGLALLSTPGHTAGHVSVLLYSGGEGGVITGDALHHPIEVEHPDWSPSADDDRELSATSRTALLDRVEAEGFLLLGGHFPAPHKGHVVRIGPRRIFRPTVG